jgi:glycosyltransferase involved in cell wall biosynthesis
MMPRPAPPAILELITTLEPDGAQTVLLDTLSALAPDRYRIILAFLSGHGSALHDWSPPPWVTVIDLSREGRFDPLSPARIARLIHRERIGIVHTHLVHAGILGKAVALMMGAPAITTRHYVADAKERTLAYRLENRLTSGAAAVIAVSRAVESHLRETGLVTPEKIVLIPNGVDLSSFDPRGHSFPESASRSGSFVIGCAGRLRAEKGQAVLLAAFSRLAHARADARLEIAGEGPLRGALEGQARRLQVAEKVRFLGHVRHGAMAATLAGWDLFVMPSLAEGFGLAAAEAMAMERAVVASRTEGLAEIVRDEETGLLVPPNDPAALSDAILALMRDPERRSRMGRTGREEIARCYSITRTAARVADLYDRIRGVAR